MRTNFPEIFSALLLLTATFPVSASDDFVTLSDGRTLVLHDNFTWAIKGSSSSQLGGDVTVTVYGDKTIVLHDNKTWEFANSNGTAESKPGPRLKSVSATATSERPSLDDARDAARIEAINKVAAQLRPYTDTAAVSLDSLAQCVELAANPVTLRQAHSAQKGWTITLRIVLKGDIIRQVLECAKGTGRKE